MTIIKRFFIHNALNFLSILFFLLILQGCSKSGSDSSIKTFVDPSFGAFVSSYTAGTISSTSPITIRLVNEVSEEVFNSTDLNDLMQVEPGIEGETYWIDKQTIEFKPTNHLKAGETYTIRFNLNKVETVPEALSYFEYLIKTIAQNYDVTIDNLTTVEGTDLKKQILTGTILTADISIDEEVEKMLEPTQNDRSLELIWDHSSDGTSHRFTISDISRTDEASQVTLSLNGNSIGSDKSDELTIDIPALGDFKLMNASVEQSGEQHIVIRFSDPIDQKQNLNGIIQVGNLRNLNFDIKGNEVLVYPTVRQTGILPVTISAGLKNVLGFKLADEITADVAFEQLKPGVRLTNKGNIISGTEGVVFPFEAVSLKAVQLTITKVFEENVSQFLQVNNLAGNNEIRRVGRPVFRRVIRLDEGLTDLTKWNRYTLDLSEFIKADPGALYQVQIGFEKYHSAYFCGETDDSETELDLLEDESWDSPELEDESSYWDYSEDYYYDDYNWSERDNPCSESYYGQRRTQRRNIIASNLGIIGKMGSNKTVFASITDIKTTEPKSGVSISVFNFQHQLIGTGSTDSDGFASIEVEGMPFLLVADDGIQKGYLKMDDGSSLSMSSFDVRGSTVNRGIKGFLYGERGVWRPGDSLHVAFILEDKDDLIPEDHPVIFELTDPLGKSAKRMVSTYSNNNFYRFSAKTESSAPTGNWNAKVTVGGAQFNKRIKIETVKPNRLKINLDFGREKITASNRSIDADLNVAWLHGAPARNLKAEFEVMLTKGKTSFEDYEDYVFDNLEKEYYSESYSVFDGYLDDDGNASINSSLYANNEPPGVVNATFMGKVYEDGGNFSIKNITLPFYPYDRFVGIKTPKGDKARGMLLTDTTHTVEVVTLNSEGDGVSSDVEVELYKMDWRWWWDNSNYGANYVSSSYQKKLESETVGTRNGKASWSFEVKYPDWGRYYIKACDTNSGHCTGKVVYIDWPGWAGRAQRDNPGGASMLSFSTDKTSYEVGERVRVDIPGSGQGRALVSLESGRKVINSYWVETVQGENPFFFETTSEMAPGVYVNITMLQEHSQTINDLPIRMYGVVPIEVNDPQTKLEPIITMAETLAPGEPVNIKISEATGRKMTYTVAVVDEGLLDLTNYSTPNPWGTFYSREALGVKTWDMFEYVMGSYGGKLERLLAIGGDGDLDTDNDNSEANRFKPVVKYMGPYTIDAGKSNTHSFIMPQYVGSVKTMVVAGDNGAYGKADQATPVKQPVMILGTLPRVLGPGEKFTLPVNVFAMEDNIDEVTVEITSNDLIIPSSANRKTVSFNRPGDQVVNFEYEVAAKLGVGKVSIKATGGGYTATEDIEIQIRNPNPPITILQESIIESGKSWNTSYSAPGIQGTNSAYLEISNIPPVDLSKRLQYLIGYPHGCIEQTTSSVFPQLYLSEIMDLSVEQTSEIEKNVKAAINRLRSFQLNGGGFSYWPGGNEANDWGTNYAGHFLIEAKNKGYDVPNSLLREWKRYQSRMSTRWRRSPKNANSDLIQAYRLYTLALEGSPETGAMNRLRESSNLTEKGAWRLAAAYSLAGQTNAATQLISNRSAKVAEYTEQGNTFGNATRDKAMILETLALMGDYTRGAAIIKELSTKLSSKNWISTQATAYSLIAIGKFTGGNKGSGSLDFNYTLNGKSEKATSDLPIVQIPINVSSQLDGNVSVSNSASGIIYARLVTQGSPIKGEEVNIQNGLRVTVKYIDKEGRNVDVSSLLQGTEFSAQVTVKNIGISGNYENLALTQIFPSGWEIINTRLIDALNSNEKSAFSYQDIRDDRVYTYFDLNRLQTKTFNIGLNATYGGEYYLPAVSCEAMYDDQVRSVISGMDVQVITGGIQ